MAIANLINVELAKPDSVPTNLGPGDSWLLCSVSTYRVDRVTGFAVQELNTSELGEHFSGVSPVEDNRYEIELGAILPDLLPNLGVHQDNTVAILFEGELQTIAISNRMQQVVFRNNSAAFLGLFPRGGEEFFQEKLGINLEENPATQLRTVATSKFLILGDSAHDAVTKNIESCLQRFTGCLNRLLSECKMLDGESYSYFSNAYHQTTFPWFYLMMGGENGINQCRLVPHAGKVAFVAQSFDSDSELELREKLKQPSALDPKRILMAARSSEQGGLTQLALLQAVIASEVATSHYVKSQLRRQGLSNNKWDDFKSDITYSQMLNIHLTGYSPPGRKPDPNLIGILNRARTLRNSLMHEGSDKLKKGEIDVILSATSKHIEYLESLSQD